jgi:hypothetical protein
LDGQGGAVQGLKNPGVSINATVLVVRGYTISAFFLIFSGFSCDKIAASLDQRGLSVTILGMGFYVRTT